MLEVGREGVQQTLNYPYPGSLRPYTCGLRTYLLHKGSASVSGGHGVEPQGDRGQRAEDLGTLSSGRGPTPWVVRTLRVSHA